MSRCEGCYCEVDDARRCAECDLVLWHSIASGIIYALTYVAVLAMLVSGSWLGLAAVLATGGFAFWRERRRMRALRVRELPRAALVVR